MGLLNKNIFFIIFSTINIAVLGVGTYIIYASTLGHEAAMITEKQMREPANLKEKFAQSPMVYTMDKFVVNLACLPKRTIRIQVNLYMIGPESFQEIMDVDNRAKARDKIVRILNEKTFDDLETIQGKLFLKDKIVVDINKILDKGLVKDVYFTDFVMN